MFFKKFLYSITKRMALDKKAEILSQRELIIAEAKRLIEEKEALVQRKESLLWSEKERMAGQDQAQVKREIILPSLQQKWEAEKNKIDAERVQILQSTPRVWESLEARKAELEKIITTIKSKPATMPNQILLTENEGRLKQLLEIISVIDSAKGALHVV